MTSVQRRLNSTGRMRITRDRVDIALEEHPDLQVIPVARASLRLEGLEVPSDAKVAIEAYYRTSSMRFPCGTVGNLSVPERMLLTDIDKGGAVRFRVLVIAADATGRILAAADGLRPTTPNDGADRQPLLPMRETDIGNELWRIEVDYRTGPTLLVSNRVSGLAAQLRTVPLLQGLILPHALRAVMQNISAGGESDEDNLWGDNWRRFLDGLGVAREPEDTGDSDAVDDWVNSAVKAFADLKEFAARAKLLGAVEGADA